MSAYRVTLLDCDLCGEVFDAGPKAVGASIRDVRHLASRTFDCSSDWSTKSGWRSHENIDICPKHVEMTMGEASLAVVQRYAAALGEKSE